MYLYPVPVPCTCTLYLYPVPYTVTLHLSLYLYHVPVPCTCVLYLHLGLVPCTLYLYLEYVPCKCTLYLHMYLDLYPVPCTMYPLPCIRGWGHLQPPLPSASVSAQLGQHQLVGKAQPGNPHHLQGGVLVHHQPLLPAAASASGKAGARLTPRPSSAGCGCAVMQGRAGGRRLGQSSGGNAILESLQT